MFLKSALFDELTGDKASFGRLVALPFLGGSFLLLMAGGSLLLWKGETDGLIEIAGTMATIGMGLFTGSKVLDLKGRKWSAAVGTSAGAVSDDDDDPPAPPKKSQAAKEAAKGAATPAENDDTEAADAA